MRCAELTNLSKSDVEDVGGQFIVTIKDTKNYYPRNFVVGHQLYDPVRRYIDLRPTDLETQRFFLTYQKGKCIRHVMGKNKISEIPKVIALYLNLDDADCYTGHCFRRTGATLLSNSGANLVDVKSLGGWRSDAVVQGYIENSLANKRKIFNGIVSAGNTACTTTALHTSNNNLKVSATAPHATSIVTRGSTTTPATISTITKVYMTTPIVISTNAKASNNQSALQVNSRSSPLPVKPNTTTNASASINGWTIVGKNSGVNKNQSKPVVPLNEVQETDAEVPNETGSTSKNIWTIVGKNASSSDCKKQNKPFVPLKDVQDTNVEFQHDIAARVEIAPILNEIEDPLEFDSPRVVKKKRSNESLTIPARESLNENLENEESKEGVAFHKCDMHNVTINNYAGKGSLEKNN